MPEFQLSVLVPVVHGQVYTERTITVLDAAVAAQAALQPAECVLSPLDATMLQHAHPPQGEVVQVVVVPAEPSARSMWTWNRVSGKACNCVGTSAGCHCHFDVQVSTLCLLFAASCAFV